MATFVIEGTVSKIKISDTHDICFCIFGLEGYAMKHGDKKFNVICNEDFLKSKQIGIVLSQEYEFMFENVIENSLVLANSLGKHIKLTFEIDESINLSEKTDAFKKPSSVTLLAE